MFPQSQHWYLCADFSQNCSIERLCYDLAVEGVHIEVQFIFEGYLVDHDAPHRLSTKLSAEGIHYKRGDTVVRYDPVGYSLGALRR